jgi:uncharacterized protein with FMN-binding domain
MARASNKQCRRVTGATWSSHRPSTAGFVVGGLAAAWLFTLVGAGVAMADSIEGKSGVVIQGKIVARDEKFVTMEVKAGSRVVQRKYGLSLIRAITIDGNREVLDGSGDKPAPGTKPAPGPTTGPITGQRSRAQVEALINDVGSTAPDWYEATPLNYPPSLDLTWPEKPPGAWNNQKNVGQYIWDIINPNESKWREGIRLMHHLLVMHKDDAEVRTRIMRTIGGMYFRLFQDYPRATFWWRKVGIDSRDAAQVAECYWKMGNKAMAVELLNKHGNLVTLDMIKLWADMGDTDRALALANLFANSKAADDAWVLAGDACRLAGRYPMAIQYYQKVLAMPDDNNVKRNKNRAQASLDAIKYFDTLDVKRVADGTYTDSSLGYQGQVEVEVKIAAGHIESVRVTKHQEKQFYAALTDTPNKIIQKQSVKGVDATSRATLTSEAIINATAKALAGGMK